MEKKINKNLFFPLTPQPFSALLNTVRNLFKITIVCSVLLFLLSFFFSPSAFAATTPFRSAKIITSNLYTNLENCSETDGKTCDKIKSSLGGAIYFRDFGNYGDFGMAEGANITQLRIRVTGKTMNVSPYVGLQIYHGETRSEACQSPSYLWQLYQLNGNAITTQTFVTDVVSRWKPGSVASYCLESYYLENKLSMFVIQ